MKIKISKKNRERIEFSATLDGKKVKFVACKIGYNWQFSKGLDKMDYGLQRPTVNEVARLSYASNLSLLPDMVFPHEPVRTCYGTYWVYVLDDGVIDNESLTHYIGGVFRCREWIVGVERWLPSE